MALESLQVWKDSYASAVTATGTPADLAAWVGARVNGKLQLSSITGPGMLFTFNVATFTAALLLLPPVPLAELGATNFSNAWSTAMASSIALTAPGTIVGSPPLPTNTFSSVTTTTIDPTSIALGAAKLIELKDAEIDSPDPKDAPIVPFMKEAFELLTITTQGLDSTPTPAGPLPLTDPARGVE